MLNHIHWLKFRTKSLHSFPPHADSHRSICLRLCHIFSDSWNTVKLSTQLSLREPKCVQNKKLCSLTVGRSKEKDLSILPESQTLCLKLSQEGLNYDDLAFSKHYICKLDKHAVGSRLLRWRERTRLAWPYTGVQYHLRAQYHTGIQYHKRGADSAKWKQGTQPGLDMKYFLNIGDFENKLYDYLCDADGRLPIAKFKAALVETGLRESDPRLVACMTMITLYQSKQEKQNRLGAGAQGYIDRENFRKCIAQNIVVLSKAFRSRFIIPDFQPFCQHIDDIYWKARDTIGGKVATYIPQLSRYSPNLWGVSICTVDGQRYSLGDVNTPFTIQSVSKPLTYGLVLDDLSPDVVHQYVGHEPSGVAFNSIGLNYEDQPHNPMVNAGAIVIGSLLKQELSLPDRFDYVSGMLQRLAGGEYVAFNNSVFLSERQTADRNFALAYYIREKKCFPAGTNLMEVMDFYFQLCSIEITAESGSVIASTLANGGVCPITGDKVLSTMAVRDILSLMHSCGMYDYSGEFAFKVGLPAKSGVSGGILLVVPNIMGIFMWSPALDAWGNSVRGVQFCQDLVGKFNFHNYDNLRYTSKKLDPCKRKEKNQTYDVVNLLFGAYNGDVSALRRLFDFCSSFICVHIFVIRKTCLCDIYPLA